MAIFRRASVVRMSLALAAAALFAGGAHAGDSQPAAPLAAPTNLDFEAGGTSDGTPIGWSMTNAGYAVSIDSEGAHGGKTCAVVSRLPDNQSQSWLAMVTQTIAAAPYRGKRVRLRGWLRMKDVAGGYAALRIRVSDAAKEPLAADRNQDHARDGTTEWTQDSLVVDVAAKAETIEYGVWLSGAGAAWIDDFVLETVGPDVPSTDVMSYPATPSNLDFEGPVHARGFPLHWLGGAPGYQFACDATSPHGGKRCAKFAWSRELDPETHVAATMGQATPAVSWRGKRVRFSGWLRTKDAAAGGAAFWMRADDAAEKLLAFDGMIGREIRDTSDWTLCEIVLDVPETATRLTYGMRVAGGGSMWCDDLKLEVVGTDVPGTGKK